MLYFRNRILQKISTLSLYIFLIEEINLKEKLFKILFKIFNRKNSISCD